VAKKPWPNDAIMITASLAGKENVADMLNPYPANCRECGAALMACSRTLEAACNLSEQYGIPIKYFCMACHAKHDMEMCDLVVDQSQKRDDWYAKIIPK